MNSKKIILLGCVAACVFAASTATAQMRGHGGSMPRMGMRGSPMSHSMGRMPMHRGPMMNSPSGLRRFGNRDFNRNDRFGVSTDSMMAASFGTIDSIISTTSTTSSLSATSAFHGGGVGVLRGVGARAIRTAITAVTTTAATVPVMDTAITVGLEWLNYRAGSLARAITMALSTESWDLRLGEQFGSTRATMDMQAELFLPAD